jgi:hypothetical protein
VWVSIAGAVALEEEDMDLASGNEELAEIDVQTGVSRPVAAGERRGVRGSRMAQRG